MKRVRWILIGLAVVFAGAQFFRPEKNASTGQSPAAIQLHYAVPQNIDALFRRSCNDCHTNNTVYPWYAEFQPVGWWLGKHIRDGKRGLNFDEFASYRLMKQYHRFNDIIEQVQNDEMPLPSYLIAHRNSRLSREEKQDLIRWCTAMRDSMKAKFPADSLERRGRR